MFQLQIGQTQIRLAFNGTRGTKQSSNQVRALPGWTAAKVGVNEQRSSSGLTNALTVMTYWTDTRRKVRMFICLYFRRKADCGVS